MANYVAHHTKMKTRLHRVEQALLDAIRTNGGPESVDKAALAVREARVRVLKAELAQIPPAEKYEDERCRVEEKIYACTEEGLGSVVARYKRLDRQRR